jgi:hypothetical protein
MAAQPWTTGGTARRGGAPTSCPYRQGRCALSAPWGTRALRVMELTERERRILAELEHQFATGTPRPKENAGKVASIQRSRRPQWMVGGAAVLGILLVVTGIGLGVATSVLLGRFLVVSWLSLVLWRLLRRVGGRIRESFEDAPPSATP